MADGSAITGDRVIDVPGGQAEWAVVAERAMGRWYLGATMSTDKPLIARNKIFADVTQNKRLLLTAVTKHAHLSGALNFAGNVSLAFGR